MADLNDKPPLEPLSEREIEVIRLVAEGQSNLAIAQTLVLSINTIKWYLQSIFTKLDVSSRTQAVATVQQMGLLTPDDSGSGCAQKKSNMPVYLSPIIGREAELAHLQAFWEDPDIRWVTILGPGGIGKTRLVVAFMTLTLVRELDEIAFVPLENVNTLERFLTAIGEAVGLPLNGTTDLTRQLLHVLRGRRLVLILDRGEHLVEAGPSIAELIGALPQLTVFLTSRVRFNMPGELVYNLGGLTYPTGPHDTGEYSAIRLFEQYAQRVQTNFQTTANRRAIAHICQLVEGLPLALELAAAWTPVLEAETIANEIAADMHILATEAPTIQERHRSIHAVFEYSWRLLADSEQAAFKRLGVFRGDFDREAAAAVAGVDLFMLRTLLDKSLVMRVGPDRFRLHDLVQHFAQEKLAEDTEAHAHLRDTHSHYYATWVWALELSMRANHISVLDVVTSLHWDMDNILTAWHWALDRPLVDDLGKYCHCLSEYHAALGMPSQTLAEFAKAIDLLRKQPAPEYQPALMRLLAYHSWQYVSSILAQWEKALAVAEEAGALLTHMQAVDAVDKGFVLTTLGSLKYLQGDPRNGRALLEAGLSTWRSADYHRGIWLGLVELAWTKALEGDFNAMKQCVDELLAFAESHHYPVARLVAHGLLGHACSALGDWAMAAQSLKRSIVAYRDLLDTSRVYRTTEPLFNALLGIAALYGWQERSEPALTLLAVAMTHPRRSEAATIAGYIVERILRFRFSDAAVDDIMNQAQQGQLSDQYLEPQFAINDELMARLLALIDLAVEM